MGHRCAFYYWLGQVEPLFLGGTVILSLTRQRLCQTDSQSFLFFLQTCSSFRSFSRNYKVLDTEMGPGVAEETVIWIPGLGLWNE